MSVRFTCVTFVSNEFFPPTVRRSEWGYGNNNGEWQRLRGFFLSSRFVCHMFNTTESLK